jgi:hypothetical protein
VHAYAYAYAHLSSLVHQVCHDESNRMIGRLAVNGAKVETASIDSTGVQNVTINKEDAFGASRTWKLHRCGVLYFKALQAVDVSCWSTVHPG